MGVEQEVTKKMFNEGMIGVVDIPEGISSVGSERPVWAQVMRVRMQKR